MSDSNGKSLTPSFGAIPEMNFDDLQPIEIPVKFRNRRFMLKEATGDAAVKYRNAMLESTKLGPDGKPVSVKGMANIEPYLVSLCLIELIADKDGKDRERPVSDTTLRGWPNRVLKPLYDTCKEISALSEEDDTEEAITKKIEDLQKKLAIVRKANGTEDKATNPSDNQEGESEGNLGIDEAASAAAG